MRISDVCVGDFYWDGKQGLREVVRIDPPQHNLSLTKTVEYRIHAARAENEYTRSVKGLVSIVGQTSRCELGSFAAWSKARYKPEEGQRKLLELRAAKTKLSPGELVFMRALSERVTPVEAAGLPITLTPGEGRAVTGLSRKGFLEAAAGEGAVTVTALGLAWLRLSADTQIRAKP